MAKVTKVTYTDDYEEMYDLEVEDAHCFYANGVLVHNSAQEIRLPTAICEEPVWMNAFLSGGDVHKNTAVELWGKEVYNKDYRKRAKILNFGILYGMSKYTASEQLGCSIEEADLMIKKFWNTMRRLKAWRVGCINKARREGTVSTIFGRPRRVRGYYANSADYKIKAFADRTVINTQIQGAAGDIMRIIMVKLDEEILSNTQEVRFLSTIHDEINFSIQADRILYWLPILLGIMEIQIGKITMECGVTLGSSWGDLYPFHLEDDRWVPTVS